jgi:hypothetical protein
MIIYDSIVTGNARVLQHGEITATSVCSSHLTTFPASSGFIDPVIVCVKVSIHYKG